MSLPTEVKGHDSEIGGRLAERSTWSLLQDRAGKTQAG